MKNFFTLYGWALRLISSALLFGLALFSHFGPGEDIVVPFIGFVIILYSVIRLVPFIKTQRSDIIKTINIMEITVSILVGLLFIMITLLTTDGLGVFFGYLLGAVLILRGAVHFYGISEGGEKGDLVTFFFHIAALIIGTFIAMTGDFTPAALIMTILVLSIVAGGYLGFESYRGYKIYRERKQLESPQPQPRPQKEVNLPTSDVPQEEDRIVS